MIQMYKVLEQKGSYKVGCEVTEAEKFYYDLKAEKLSPTITVLPSFDDGSFECFNFWLADSEGTRQVDASFIDKTLGMKSQIETEMKKGKRYISCKGLVYGGLEILEIQWG